MRGEIGRGAAATGNAWGAVEQAHNAFDDEYVGVRRSLCRQRVEQARRHRPGIQINARRAARGAVERRIDVIRPGLGGAHVVPALLQRCEQRQHHRGLAGAGLRRRDDESARTHAEVFSAAEKPASSLSRKRTISPITTMAGGSMFCERTVAASFSSVEITMRWSGVVAEAITAAGMSPPSPAASRAAAIRSRLCITM